MLALAVMAVIFWFSSRDATASTAQSDSFILMFLRGLYQGEIPWWLSVAVRKTAHFVVYALLGAFVLCSLEKPDEKKLLPIVYAEGICILYAMTDELHQMFVPGRAGRFLDLLIDSLGALVGIFTALLMLLIIYRIKEKRSCR